MTNAELVILSLIAERPRHGYQIEQVIEEREMREWTDLGFSSIYYILNKLEGQGYIESKVEQAAGRGPARKVYTITQSGFQACQVGILESLAEPPRPESMFLLGLANLPAVPQEEALSALLTYESHLTERREHLQNRAQLGADSFPTHVAAMFDFSLKMIQAELAWVKQFIEQMEVYNGKKRFQEGT
jgi:DNA-binding PadR family transcriptional regulator